MANSLGNYFNRNGSIPSVYGALTPAGLTQASGPIATAVHPTMMMAAAQFMTAMTDVSGADRLGPSSATAFADDGDVMNAYADVRLRGTGGETLSLNTKAAPRAPAFEPRWRTWASAFGGGQITDGNAATGSSTTTYQYDALGHVTLVIAPDGSQTSKNISTVYGAKLNDI